METGGLWGARMPIEGLNGEAKTIRIWARICVMPLGTIKQIRQF